MAPEGRVSTRFILRLRLSTEHHYAFKPSPCLKRVELPLNEQIFNTIGINVDGLNCWVNSANNSGRMTRK
ncbi:hypothetical protein [Shewanella sp. SM101]|uniref:hypothetical protein n=1 Tax=Shewanella TaxID=22 RepID=UPI0021DACF1E|nr:hypothetical protein [Shewanella sp. SM101]MCU8103061.1 hypothetical protein [Shewanella sp. SM101]